MRKSHDLLSSRYPQPTVVAHLKRANSMKFEFPFCFSLGIGRRVCSIFLDDGDCKQCTLFVFNFTKVFSSFHRKLTEAMSVACEASIYRKLEGSNRTSLIRRRYLMVILYFPTIYNPPSVNTGQHHQPASSASIISQY